MSGSDMSLEIAATHEHLAAVTTPVPEQVFLQLVELLHCPAWKELPLVRRLYTVFHKKDPFCFFHNLLKL